MVPDLDVAIICQICHLELVKLSFAEFKPLGQSRSEGLIEDFSVRCWPLSANELPF